MPVVPGAHRLRPLYSRAVIAASAPDESFAVTVGVAPAPEVIGAVQTLCSVWSGPVKWLTSVNVSPAESVTLLVVAPAHPDADFDHQPVAVAERRRGTDGDGIHPRSVLAGLLHECRYRGGYRRDCVGRGRRRAGTDRVSGGHRERVGRPVRQSADRGGRGRRRTRHGRGGLGGSGQVGRYRVARDGAAAVGRRRPGHGGRGVARSGGDAGGAAGAVGAAGVTALDAADAGPVPTALVAVTVNV